MTDIQGPALVCSSRSVQTKLHGKAWTKKGRDKAHILYRVSGAQNVQEKRAPKLLSWPEEKEESGKL